MLNEFCANQQHVKKAAHVHIVKFVSMKLEVPLCEECHQMVASGRFSRYTT